MRKTMRPERPDRVESPTSTSSTPTSPTAPIATAQAVSVESHTPALVKNSPSRLPHSAAAAAAAAAQSLKSVPVMRTHTNTRGKPPGDGSFKAHTLRNKPASVSSSRKTSSESTESWDQKRDSLESGTPAPQRRDSRARKASEKGRVHKPRPPVSAALRGLYEGAADVYTDTGPGDAELAWQKMRKWHDDWREKQKAKEHEKHHDKLKAQISGPMPIAKGLPSTALALLEGDGGVNRAKRLTPPEMRLAGLVHPLLRAPASTPAVPTMANGKDGGKAVERPVPKRPIRLASEGPDGQRRDTMFGDFVKTPPETPHVPEVTKTSRWERRIPEPLLSMPYNAAEPMRTGMNRPLQERTPEVPPRDPSRRLPPIPDEYSSVSSGRVNTMQRTYSLPGNPFADFDGVHSPAVAEEAEDVASRDSWEGYSLDSLNSDGSTRPLVSERHLQGNEGGGEEEYVPPRQEWGWWNQMNGRVSSARDERTDKRADKRNTKFYKFYDEILDE